MPKSKALPWWAFEGGHATTVRKSAFNYSEPDEDDDMLYHDVIDIDAPTDYDVKILVWCGMPKDELLRILNKLIKRVEAEYNEEGGLVEDE